MPYWWKGKGNRLIRGASQRMVRRVQVAGIAVVVFALPLVMWPGLTDYNYAKCILGLIAISILLVVWGFNAWRQEPWVIRIPWVLAPMLGLVLACALSALQAESSLIVAQSMILLVAFILLFWMTANVVQTPQEVRWILISLLASGSLAAIYGLLQYAGVVSGSPGRTGIHAIISTMGNRNHLGGFLLYLFYPSIILLLHSRRLWAKALTLALTTLCTVVMLLVQQSGTRIVFVLASITLVLGWLIFRPAKCSRTNKRWLAALFCIIVCLCVGSTLVSLRTDHPAADTASINPPSSETSWLAKMWHANSGEEREWFWWIGAEMLADHPVSGIGLGNYKIAYSAYETQFASSQRGRDYAVSVDRVSQAHNEVVQVGAELGAIGLFMLLFSIGTLVVSLWVRLRMTSKHSRLDLMLLSMGILSIIAHALVSFPAHVASSSLELVVFCGLALSLRFGDTMSSCWSLRGWKAKSIHGLLVMSAILITVIASNDLRANRLMEQGISHVQSGAYALGETTLQHSLALDFAPRQTYYYLAVAQIRLGKFSEAEENLEKCQTRFVDRNVLLTTANLKLSLGDLDQAQTVVDMLLLAHPPSAIERQARYIEGVIAVQQQQIDRAIHLLEKLTVDHPEYEMGFVALGQIYAATNMPLSAQQNFQAALELIRAALDNAQNELTELGTSSSIAQSQIQAQIELLTQQRSYLLDELSQLP